MISFTIAGEQYYAEPDMTWGDWVNSEYNVDDEFWDNGTYIGPNGEYNRYVGLNGTGITKNDVIVAGAAYTFKYGGAD